MATLDIFPLAVNGIAPPLNLLAKLYSNPLNPSNLLYPLDLASNPVYGHAVQFQIFDYKYQIDTNNISPGGFKPIQGAKLSTISLYLPDSLTDSHHSDYSEVSLTEMMGVIGKAGSAIADGALEAIKGTDKDKGNNLSAGYWGASAASVASSLLGGGLTTTAVGNYFKQVPNPQLQMLYKAVDLRTFQFDFKFTPVSQQEADAVDKIIQSFRYFSAPKILGPVSHQYLEPPQLFDISFAFTGGNSLSTSVANFFGNLGTNLLTSQINASSFGSASSSIGSSTAKIYEIYHPCVLQDMTVDYAPNGWAAYDDGYPVEITLSLTFKETDIADKDSIANSPSGRGAFLRGVASPGFSNLGGQAQGAASAVSAPVASAVSASNVLGPNSLLSKSGL